MSERTPYMSGSRTAVLLLPIFIFIQSCGRITQISPTNPLPPLGRGGFGTASGWSAESASLPFPTGPDGSVGAPSIAFFPSYNLGPRVTSPKPIQIVEPAYTAQARAAKREGTVEVVAVVDEYGDVTSVRVDSPLGLGLDQSAMAAMREWRFNPGDTNGAPGPMTIGVKFTFRIKDAGSASAASLATAPRSNAPLRLISDVVEPNPTVSTSAHVLVSYVVGSDGMPKNITIEESGGEEADKAVRDAIAARRYEPAVRGRAQIESSMTQGFTFQSAQPELPAADLLLPEAPEYPPMNIAGLDNAPLPAGVYRVGGDVTTPTVVFQYQPPYPDETRAAGIAGSVLVRVIVGLDGKASDVQVLQPLGGGLDEKAVTAAKVWRFKPGEKGGMPVPVEITIEFPFRPN